MEEKKENISLSLVAAAIVLFIYFFQASVWSENGRFSNIKLYIVGVAIFFIVLIVGIIIENTIAKNKEMPLFVKKIGIVWMVIGSGYYLYQSFCLEMDSLYNQPAAYLRHNIPGLIYFLIMTICTVISFFLIKKSHAGSREIKILFSGLSAFIQAWFTYAPNFFKDNSGGLFHMDAYTNSIINALNLSSFEQYSASIYGHYGIFFIIPVKVLHKLGFNQWRAVTITIAILAGIVFAMEYWVISQIIDNDLIFMMAVLAGTVISTQIYYNQFYQMLPHRYVFQAFLLGGTAYIYKKENRDKKIFKIMMWILAAAAIVWNTETGIVCAIVWMLGSLYIDAEKDRRYTLKIIAKNAGLLVIAVMCAYGFVNLYNILVGGNIVTFQTFLYPLGSNSFPVENLQLVLQIPCAGYFLPILLLLGILGYYFIKIIKADLNKKEFIVILAAIMGIGVYTYYMNRAVTSNAAIVSFTFVLAAAYVVDQNFGKGEWEVPKKISAAHIGSGMCLIAIVSMMLSSIASFGTTLAGKTQTTFETESLNQFVEDIKGRIPEGTVAFGMGTAQLFSYMNLKTGIYIADWEDLDGSINGGETIMNQEALNYLISKLDESQYPYIFINTLQAGYIPEGYVQIDTYDYNGYSFALYEKK